MFNEQNGRHLLYEAVLFMLRFSQMSLVLQFSLMAALGLMGGWPPFETRGLPFSVPVLSPLPAEDLLPSSVQVDEADDETDDDDLLIRESDQDDDRASDVKAPSLYRPQQPAVYSVASSSQKTPVHFFARALATRGPPH